MMAALFDVSIDNMRNQRLPEGAPSWFASNSHGIEVSGDRVEYRETFVWHSNERVLIATNLGELLTRLKSDSRDPAVSPFGISQVLNHGFSPVPHTAYEGVERLAGGDTAEFTVEEGQIARSITSSYPWLARLSRQDQTPSTTKLRELIASSVDRQMSSVSGDAMLMMSSGKDSTSLAIGLADGGHTSVPCFTFKSESSDREHVFAAEICNRLGLEHHTVPMPEDPATTKAALLRFFENSPLPSADLATIPYAIVTHAAGLDHGGIMDGCGNDAYMGYLPSGHIKLRNGLRTRSRRIAKAVQRTIPHDSRTNYFARSKAGALLPGRMFRDRETRQFYAEAMDTEDFWYRLSSDSADLDLADFVAATEVRHTDPARSNNKIHLAARASGLTPLLPFCDEAIADYCFNLPEASRLDRSRWVGKLLLRRHLAEAIDYDPAVAGSHHFQFDGASFLLDNEDFVREEILSCDLWLPKVEPMLDGWMDALPRRPFLFHSLIALFMISGWHNHSVFLGPDSPRQ